MLNELTKEEINNIFGNWDGKLKLIPIWLIHQFDNDEIFVSINGDECKKSDIDLDHRGGWLAYGWNSTKGETND